MKISMHIICIELKVEKRQVSTKLPIAFTFISLRAVNCG